MYIQLLKKYWNNWRNLGHFFSKTKTTTFLFSLSLLIIHIYCGYYCIKWIDNEMKKIEWLEKIKSKKTKKSWGVLVMYRKKSIVYKGWSGSKTHTLTNREIITWKENS